MSCSTSFCTAVLRSRYYLNTIVKGESDQERLSKILRPHVKCAPELREDTRDFIHALLEADIESRPTVRETLALPWMKRMLIELGHHDPALGLPLPLFTINIKTVQDSPKMVEPVSITRNPIGP